jgi:two-component system alkaline phosphatase synthesis response regulator PhoP
MEATRGTKTIFVVEDDDDIARLISHNLEVAGFLVRRFSRATPVVPEAEQRPPALFLLDLMLPDMDGFELCRNIRQNTVLRKVPIIILSARTTARERKQALESGANDYVTKPFSPQDLILRVKASCGNAGR